MPSCAGTGSVTTWTLTFLQPVDERDQHCQARLADPLQGPAEPEHDAALDLVDHPNAAEQHDRPDRPEHDE